MRATNLVAAGGLIAVEALSANAQPAAPGAVPSEAQAAPAPAAEAPPPGLWINGIHLSAQVEAGIMGNPSGPADGPNFGHAFINNHPFNAQRDNNVFTLATDAVLTFREIIMNLYGIYMSKRSRCHRIYMVRGLVYVQRNMPAACGGVVADPGATHA